jgi:transcriptional regulator with XRE-family HTH domain
MLNDVCKSIKNLKDLRLQEGLTQEKLAILLDVRVKTISDWERGVNQPRMSPSRMLFLCQTLNCSLEELVLAIEESGRKTSNFPTQEEKNDKELVAA